MGKLIFTEKISGIRVDTTEELGEMPSIMEYKDTPETIRKHHWWTLMGISIEFQGWNEKIARNAYNDKEVLNDIFINQRMKDESFIMIDSDDAVTYWVYINRQDLWKELVEHFKNEDYVWNTYLRWGH